jgi:hypothetical protein
MLSAQRRLTCLLALALAGASISACATQSGQGEIGPDDNAPFADDGKADDPSAPAYSNSRRDIISTSLDVNLATRHATADVRVATSTSRGMTFEAQGLNVTGVHSAAGAELEHAVSGGKLYVNVPGGRWPTNIVVDYTFDVQHENNGWLGASTVTWPYFCGNLFPCRSATRDGSAFALNLTGVPSGQTAIYPSTIDEEAPAYMLAWAVGNYECQSLGTTDAGTDLKVCWLPRGKTAALAGTAHLVDVFNWYETNLGPYMFGSDVGAVSVNWGESGAGGMEHHPYWHVDDASMASEETQAHEAAHGWYGDGVRIACWEDFVLSEGTVTYLAAHALGEVAGDELEEATWASYQEDLDYALENEEHTNAWPQGCGQIDLLNDHYFTMIPYIKGAMFYRSLAREIGEEALDGVLATFYQSHAGQAMHMQDMLSTIETETGFDPTNLARHWLRNSGDPQ